MAIELVEAIGPSAKATAATVKTSRITEPELQSETMQSILTINGGSSSIKFALYEGEPLRRRLDGKVDRVGLSGTNLTFKDSTEKPDSGTIGPTDHRSAIAFLLDWLETQVLLRSKPWGTAWCMGWHIPNRSGSRQSCSIN